MIKQPVPDTLRELWVIKDETAQRFQTAAAYFEHLALQPLSPHRAAKVATPTKPAARRRTSAITPA